MTGHNRVLPRRWLLLALAVVLISSHALVLRYALQHKSISASVAAGVMILVVMTHLGLLGRLYALFPKSFSSMSGSTMQAEPAQRLRLGRSLQASFWCSAYSFSGSERYVPDLSLRSFRSPRSFSTTPCRSSMEGISSRNWQLAGDAVGRYANRFGHVAQGVFDDRFAPAFTEKQSNGRRIRGGSK